VDPDRLRRDRHHPGAVDRADRASYGDALFAARAAGLVGPQDDWNAVSDTVEPNEANREVYDRLYEVYQQLYPATKEQVHALAALQLEEGVTPEG